MNKARIINRLADLAFLSSVVIAWILAIYIMHYLATMMARGC